MGNLLVRNLDEELIRELKTRAGRKGVSAEAEHRQILEDALRRGRRRCLAEVLRQMPDVGRDSDFERRDECSGGDVFD